MADLRPGTEFAGHRIEGIAGRGGMGTVYRATHLVLDHEVALKVISAELASDEAFRERFRSESRIAVSLRHPNVVPVHHAGEEDGRLFVTMDLIDGPDLRRLLLSGGTLDPARAAALQQAFLQHPTHDVGERRAVDARASDELRLTEPFILRNGQEHGVLTRREVDIAYFADKYVTGALPGAMQEVDG